MATLSSLHAPGCRLAALTLNRNGFNSPSTPPLLRKWRRTSSTAAKLEVRRGTSVAVSATASAKRNEEEVVFFDGGPHIGDLIANLVFGLSLLWLPLTLASVFRSLFLRYRFTNLRVTVVSGLTGSDRKDFSYKVISDVKYVPRFIGEWGDIVITLSDGTQVELKCVPKFRELSQYCLRNLENVSTSNDSVTSSSRTRPSGPKGITGSLSD